MRREYDFYRGKRGEVAKVGTKKTRITIRLDNDIFRWFKKQVHAAGGGNYQTLINQALRDSIRSTDESLEDTLRRVVREEISEYGKNSD